MLEARHRAHARMEDRIRFAKDTGLANFPFEGFVRNQVWLTLALMAQDLTAWTQLLCLDGELARVEPKRFATACCMPQGPSCVEPSGSSCACGGPGRGRLSWLAAFDRLRALPT